MKKFGIDSIEDIVTNYAQRIEKANSIDESKLGERALSVKKELEFRYKIFNDLLLYIKNLPLFMRGKELRNKEEIINCVNRKINTILNSGTEDEKTKKSALETAIRNNSAMWDNVTTGIRFGQNYDFENFVEFYIDIVDYIASFTGFYIEYREVIIPIIK